MSAEFTFPSESRALKEFICEEAFYEQGFELIEEDREPAKHSTSDVAYILKHTATGRFLQVTFQSDYNWGPEDSSFEASEVFPHTVTTTVYKGKPQA